MSIKVSLTLRNLGQLIYAMREFHLIDEGDWGKQYLVSYLEQVRRMAEEVERDEQEIDIDNIPF